MNTLISVVIPCYNAASFLEETLESVFCQTYSNIEVILIDDGSTDNTAQIIRSFGSKVRAEFGSNRGASVARNRGTQIAQGEVIQYLDADDLLEKDALEKRMKALKTSGADVAYSDWQYLEKKEDGRFRLGYLESRRIEDIHNDPQIAVFTAQFWAPPAALLYHRSVVNAIGGWNESLPIIQDARFLLDAVLVGGKFVHVPGLGAYYRVHGASLSHRNPTAFAQDIFCNACQVETFWRNNGGITPERHKALIAAYAQVARFFFEHDRLKFFEVVRKISALDPNYLPSGPKILRLLSRLVGYEEAESMALVYRQFKRYLIL